VTERILIPLAGIGTLELTREAYDAALRPLAAPGAAEPLTPAELLVSAKVLAGRLSLPVSCLYEYARAGRIPCVRVGKHLRFSPRDVLAVLGGATGGRR
jgi:Helix-turn-helix domain